MANDPGRCLADREFSQKPAAELKGTDLVQINMLLDLSTVNEVWADVALRMLTS